MPVGAQVDIGPVQHHLHILMILHLFGSMIAFTLMVSNSAALP